jgi:lysozyme
LSFSYNLGANFYGSSDFNTITRVLREKKWNEVPKALELYRNPGTNVEKGLLRRRIAEGALWKSI